MSKKHFIALATGFRNQLSALNADNHGRSIFEKELVLRTFKATVQTVADVAADANPSFNYDRFYAACGL